MSTRTPRELDGDVARRPDFKSSGSCSNLMAPGFRPCRWSDKLTTMTQGNEEGVQLSDRARHKEEGVGGALPNQPMERTLPRCALQRRSSARWADAVRIVPLRKVVTFQIRSTTLRVSIRARRPNDDCSRKLEPVLWLAWSRPTSAEQEQGMLKSPE